jgi:hypothetical protein
MTLLAALPAGARSAPGLLPPAIPAHGAYLGAWVNPQGARGKGLEEKPMKELSQLAAFNASVGRPVAILHAFSGFLDPLPTRTLAAIERNGSIPLLDWHCGDVADINAGKDDKVIDTYAKGVRAFGKPMFIRWYWEMNLDKHKPNSCDAFGKGPAFVAAWRRIRTIFTADGATNAAFVWCPSAHGDVTPYYPGDNYVDWVAGDKFDRTGRGQDAFGEMFGSYLATLPTHNKPFMVGATGASATDQAAFLRGIGRDAPKYPQIKAIMYFDSPGKHGFVLQGDGLAAFKALLADPYFSFRG